MEQETRQRSTAVDFRSLFRDLRHRLKAGSGDTQQSLQGIVELLAAYFEADVCSIYQYDEDRNDLFLRATVGLRPEAVGRTTLRMGEGLVGTIAETRHFLALENALEDPRFLFMPETGEEIYHSFLGVPLIRAGTLLGALVVQHADARSYGAEEIETVETVAQFLSEMLHEFTGGGFTRAAAGPRQPVHISAIPLSAGVAQGKAVLHLKDIVIRRWRAADGAAERKRVSAALRALEEALTAALREQGDTENPEIAELLEATLMMARDKGWREKINLAIDRGLSAEAAVQRVREDLRARMAAVTNDYIRARLDDLDNLSYRLLAHLTGEDEQDIAAGLAPGSILVARSLSASELLKIGKDRLAGLVVADGTPSSHLSIVAASLNIPALGQAAAALEMLRDGDPVIVDAVNGQLIVRPEASVRHAFDTHISAWQKEVSTRDAVPVGDCRSRDGRRMEVMANAGLLLDLEEIDSLQHVGIGLYRTEMAFLVRAEWPSVDEQAGLYRRVLDRMGDRPVVFRTLDIGSDKQVAGREDHSRESNPALGWRAIRQALDCPDILENQLRALLIAADGRPLRVMFPMVTDVAEIAAARRILAETVAAHEAGGGRAPARLDIGAMIEVPSLLWDLDRLFRHVDFASVGTNDLFQFLHAADRTNAKTDQRYNPLTAVNLRVLSSIARTAGKHGVPVSVCGEMAATGPGAIALMGCGFRSFSVRPSAVRRLVRLIGSTDARKAEAAVAQLMNDDDGNASVEKFIREFGLSDTAESHP